MSTGSVWIRDLDWRQRLIGVLAETVSLNQRLIDIVTILHYSLCKFLVVAVDYVIKVLNVFCVVLVTEYMRQWPIISC